MTEVARAHIDGCGRHQFGGFCDCPFADDAIEAILAAMTSSDQRRYLGQLRTGSAFLGSGLWEIPRVTATALERRGLLEREGSKVKLTELGQQVAELRYTRLNNPAP